MRSVSRVRVHDDGFIPQAPHPPPPAAPALAAAPLQGPPPLFRGRVTTRAAPSSGQGSAAGPELPPRPDQR
ncbi:hypothetical protein CCMA1212_010189 [Trichoderma ghanense]|uniref:Uncharacterized protein n=1 Tax=Trichoderma ghanense TaxID=65468 RepID=A0ABY2GQG5_9HYPO